MGSAIPESIVKAKYKELKKAGADVTAVPVAVMKELLENSRRRCSKEDAAQGEDDHARSQGRFGTLVGAIYPWALPPRWL